MRMKFILAVLFSAVLSAPSLALDADETAALIGRAETARLRAAELEYEWRFTAKRIEEAKKALADGDLETANAKAGRALFEAERAIEQAAISEATWELAAPK